MRQDKRAAKKPPSASHESILDATQSLMVEEGYAAVSNRRVVTPGRGDASTRPISLSNVGRVAVERVSPSGGTVDRPPSASIGVTAPAAGTLEPQRREHRHNTGRRVHGARQSPKYIRAEIARYSERARVAASRCTGPAHCESYVLVGLLNKDGRTRLINGRYIDHLERRADGWKIKLRRSTVNPLLAGDASILHTPIFKEQGYTKGRQNNGDIPYQWPLILDQPVTRW